MVVVWRALALFSIVGMQRDDSVAHCSFRVITPVIATCLTDELGPLLGARDGRRAQIRCAFGVTPYADLLLHLDCNYMDLLQSEGEDFVWVRDVEMSKLR